jgi:hypothetical protein
MTTTGWGGNDKGLQRTSQRQAGAQRGAAGRGGHRRHRAALRLSGIDAGQKTPLDNRRDPGTV